MRDLGTTARPPKPSAGIVRVDKKPEGAVLFAKASLGRIEGGAVVGVATGGGWERVEVPKPVQLARKSSDGRIYEITGSDGRVHPVWEVLSEDENRLVILRGIGEPTRVSIPLGEIASITVRKFSFIKTGLVFAAFAGVGAAVLVHYLRNRD
jgi:hypothetical protein